MPRYAILADRPSAACSLCAPNRQHLIFPATPARSARIKGRLDAGDSCVGFPVNRQGLTGMRPTGTVILRYDAHYSAATYNIFRISPASYRPKNIGSACISLCSIKNDFCWYEGADRLRLSQSKYNGHHTYRVLAERPPLRRISTQILGGRSGPSQE